MEACNVHNPESRHCPWCLESSLSGYTTFAAVIFCQAIISFWSNEVTILTRLIVGLLTFPIVAGTSGLLWGFLSRYWSL